LKLILGKRAKRSREASESLFEVFGKLRSDLLKELSLVMAAHDQKSGFAELKLLVAKLNMAKGVIMCANRPIV
jgi:hypothetical protein